MAPNNEQDNRYETQRYAGDQAVDTRRAMNHMPDEDRSTTQDLQQSISARQAAELAPEVRIGDDRVIGDTPNWDGYDSEQLYKFATENNSPTTADNLGRAFNDGGNSLVDAANALFDAVAQLDGAWSGVAADSARQALGPLAQAAGLAGQTAQLMGTQMAQQSVAATEVRKLPPAKTYDSQQALNAMMTGGPVAMQQDMKAQKDAADAVKREQISYLNVYTASMSAVDAQTPSFVPPQERINGGTGNRNPLVANDVYIPNSNPVPGHQTTTGSPSSRYSGVAGAAPHGIGENSGQTEESNFTPALPTPSTATSGYQPPTNTFGPSGPAPLSGPGGPSALPGAGAGGFGGGFGNFGGGSGGAGGPGGAGGNAGGRPGAFGPGGGFGPGGAGGRGGPGAMGGAPRGKGDGEDDQEHERPAYLVEGDPESTFGNDALTAPPVIGGDD